LHMCFTILNFWSMKIHFIKIFTSGALMLLMIFMASCKNEPILGETDKYVLNTDTSLSLKAASINLPGRSLAANCFQCHGTNGYAGELKIAGQSASGIIRELEGSKAKDPRANIMNVHARAYTTEEIKAIADYISKQ